MGGVAVVALSYLMGVGRYNGAGMGVITAAVEQGQALPWDFICKILLTALTLSAGFKGGEVVPSFYIGATFGCAFGPLLGLPAGFSAAVGLVSVFCGATNTLIPSILLAYELFGGVGLELIALGCGVCYMLSGTHGLYSSQLFVTEKLLSEYTESWGNSCTTDPLSFSSAQPLIFPFPVLQSFVVSSCDAQCAQVFCRRCVKIKCPKTMMRTNRSPVLHAAERAAVRKDALQAACHVPDFYHRRVQRRTSAGCARYSTASGVQ